jgi:hypothetical protein
MAVISAIPASGRIPAQKVWLACGPVGHRTGQPSTAGCGRNGPGQVAANVGFVAYFQHSPDDACGVHRAAVLGDLLTVIDQPGSAEG